MSEQTRLSVIAYWRRVLSFVCPWRAVRSRENRNIHSRGIGRHFAAVGRHLSRAVEQYASQHPEIPAYA